MDIVPNHMAMSPRHNRALWEVLREGPSARRARWFDIDWEAQGGPGAAAGARRARSARRSTG
ncbi:hypothetical protein GCM10019016_139070 [Streptomyces prasinosporus]|uniref:Uncharacterized protein n=1 Tax=Streptomyces prasinosporus TaxID=68256 RepID=A0ABP6UGM8_9ACTN